MKKSLKTIISVILAIIMTMSVMITPISASEGEVELDISNETKFDWGDTVTFNIVIKNNTDSRITNVDLVSEAKGMSEYFDETEDSVGMIDYITPGATRTVEVKYATESISGISSFFRGISTFFSQLFSRFSRSYAYTEKIKVGFSNVTFGIDVEYEVAPPTASGDVNLDDPEPDVEIYSFDSDYRSLIVSEETLVKFEAEIFAETVLSSDEVVVYQNNTVLGVMQDDGINGDDCAEDGIYTYQTMLSSDVECTKSYQVKVRDTTSEIRTIGFYIPMTDEELNGVQSVDESIKDLVQSEEFNDLTIDERADLVVRLLNELANDGLVVEGTIYYDLSDKAVYYKYITGALGAVMLEEQNDTYNSMISSEKNKDKTKATNKDVACYDIEQTVFYDNSLNTNTRDVLILNGFENESFRRNYYNNLESEWDGIGLNTTVDIDVTVRDMKALDASNWDVIVFAMHGNKHTIVEGEDERPVLCINEVPTATTDSDYDYELNQTETVIKVMYIDGTEGYWITPQFFTDNYNSVDFEGKMFFSETCMFYGCDCQSTTPDYTLANTIVDRSAEVVIGYHNSVEANYSRDVMKIVIEESFNGATVNSALRTAMQEEGADDDWRDVSEHKYEAYPLIAGNGNFVLRPDGGVAGVIKNASTSSAVSNALIRVYNDGNIIASTRTGWDGKYTLAVPAGDYILKVSAGGYKAAKMAVTVRSNAITYNETFLLISNGLSTGYANGSTINAITGELLPNVRINIRKSWNNQQGQIVETITSNENGYYEVSLPAGLYTFECYKDGYITTYKNVIVFIYDYGSQDITIAPELGEGYYRVVLTWGENPSDLDSHLFGTTNDYSYRTYFGNRNGYNTNGDVVANLDVDDTTSYGPETTTFYVDSNANYEFYVDWYSGYGTWASSGGKVEVYNGAYLINTYYVPSVDNNYGSWKVFSIEDGVYTSHNIIQSNDIY